MFKEASRKINYLEGLFVVLLLIGLVFLFDLPVGSSMLLVFSAAVISVVAIEFYTYFFTKK